MITLKTKADISMLSHLPVEIIYEVERVIDILDENYTKYGLDGGYVLIFENQEDINKTSIDLSEYEFIDRIETSVGNYISALYLIGTEYSVTAVMLEKLAPKNLLTF